MNAILAQVVSCAYATSKKLCSIHMASFHTCLTIEPIQMFILLLLKSYMPYAFQLLDLFSWAAVAGNCIHVSTCSQADEERDQEEFHFGKINSDRFDVNFGTTLRCLWTFFISSSSLLSLCGSFSFSYLWLFSHGVDNLLSFWNCRNQNYEALLTTANG